MTLALLLLAVFADIRGCNCDPAKPDTLEARDCALTRIVAADRTASPVLFVHDSSPTKPNRWLALPHQVRRTLDDMTADERSAYWAAAIAKAKELWGGNWGLAVNGEERRSQCQLHVHIGKLLSDVDRAGGVVVDTPAEIPIPPPGTGIWIAAEGNKLLVHAGVEAPELFLMR